ncbi:MAG: amidohydrolase family protein [Candidatus Lambdaproteobacteria bacterium]|nr:amidohydrolase family protein [Candidatus Lambdaproteobacteria bacterium]
MRIDTHVHIYTADAGLIPERGYTPERWVTGDDFIQLLDENGMTHGLLVQPSVLGTNNGLLVEALRKYPARLRGIAVIDPAIAETDLLALDAAGVVGIRLNAVSFTRQVDYGVGAWQKLYARIAKLKWVIQIFCGGAAQAKLLDDLRDYPHQIVLDHFGRPDISKGLADEGFQAVLKAGRSGRVWVKLSCLRQTIDADMLPYAKALLDGLGPDRLVWGTNWPWNGYVTRMTYRRNLDWLEQWAPDAEQRARILGEHAATLFRFPQG